MSHRTLQADRPEDVAAEIRKALKYIPPERLIVSSDCGFGRQGCNREIAFYKATAIAQGCNIVRQELGLPTTYVAGRRPGAADRHRAEGVSRRVESRRKRESPSAPPRLSACPGISCGAGVSPAQAAGTAAPQYRGVDLGQALSSTVAHLVRQSHGEHDQRDGSHPDAETLAGPERALAVFYST